MGFQRGRRVEVVVVVEEEELKFNYCGIFVWKWNLESLLRMRSTIWDGWASLEYKFTIIISIIPVTHSRVCRVGSMGGKMMTIFSMHCNGRLLWKSSYTFHHWNNNHVWFQRCQTIIATLYSHINWYNFKLLLQKKTIVCTTMGHLNSPSCASIIIFLNVQFIKHHHHFYINVWIDLLL